MSPRNANAAVVEPPELEPVLAAAPPDVLLRQAAEDVVPTPDLAAGKRFVVSAGRRLAALVVLGAFAAIAVWVGHALVTAFSDAWAAPLHFSPDHEQVVQFKLRLSRERNELARAESEVARIGADLTAVDAAISRLKTLRHEAARSITWRADMDTDESASVTAMLAQLRSAREIQERLYARQQHLLETAQQDFAAGLVDRNELERQQQALDGIAVSIADNQRDQEQALLRQKQLQASAKALREGLNVPGARTRQPEVAAGVERETRLDVELIRLEAERRGLETVRAAAAEAVQRESQLLDELKSRPLFRALDHDTDVAFVPYTQLDGVVAGARVFACTFGVFRCHDVGRVAQVLPGEVVTQDPWSSLARGQYALLDLSDPEAVREKVVRIRR